MNTLSNSPPQSINILAFDTSCDEASLALWTGGHLHKLAIPLGTGPHSQAACLIPMMQNILTDQGITFQDLDIITTPTGPGSFTGIRLGLATAQGLLLSTKAKGFAPTTFQLLAFGAWKERKGSYLVTLSTKRDSFYSQGFDENLNTLFPGIIQTEEEIETFLEHHPNSNRVKTSTNLGAENLIHLCLHELIKTDNSLQNRQEKNAQTLHPYYLHDPVFVKQKLCSL